MTLMHVAVRVSAVRESSRRAAGPCEIPAATGEKYCRSMLRSVHLDFVKNVT